MDMFLSRKILTCLGLAVGLVSFAAGPAMAQFTANDSTIPSNPFNAGFAAEIRYFWADIDASTSFNGTVDSISSSQSSVDPGVEAFVGIPVTQDGNGSAFVSVWAAPTTEVVLSDRQIGGGGDYANLRFGYQPNIVSGFVGYDQQLMMGDGYMINGRVYGGFRVAQYDLDVSGQAVGGGTPYSYSNSGSVVLPAGGVDLSVEHHVDLPNGTPVYMGLAVGAQLQGGFDVNAGAGNVPVSSQIGVDPAVTGYMQLRIRRNF